VGHLDPVGVGGSQLGRRGVSGHCGEGGGGWWSWFMEEYLVKGLYLFIIVWLRGLMMMMMMIR